MAIVAWPEGAAVPSTVPCVICHAERPRSEVSAGLCRANGEQAFACDGHFWFCNQLLAGWATFASAERQLLDLQSDTQTSLRGGHGWILR